MTNRRSRVARIADQRLSSQQAENRQNRQCQTSIPRKRACQNHALLEIVQGETPVDVHACTPHRAIEHVLSESVQGPAKCRLLTPARVSIWPLHDDDRLCCFHIVGRV